MGLIALDIKLRQSKVGGMDNLDYTMAGAQILGVGLYAAGFFPPSWPGIVTAGLYASALYLFENGIRNLANLIPEARKRVYFDWLKNASKHQQFKSSQQASADFACDYISGLSSNIGTFGHVWPSETMLLTFRNHYKEIEYKQFGDCCLKLVKASK